MSEKISWNELKIGECFLGPGGMYRKNSENEAFYFNAYAEITVDKEENKNNKVFERVDKK